ncbi:MAG: MBL fold metallo-hydrolase [Pseudomonadota bacterium]
MTPAMAPSSVPTEAVLAQRHGIVRIEEPLPFGPASVNFYLLCGPPPVLIDAGMRTPRAMDLLREAAESVGVELRDIAHVFLTHAHVDHAGLAPTLAERYGAEVWAHPGEAVRLDGGQARFMDQALPRLLARLGAAPDMVEVFMGGLAPAIDNYRRQIMDGFRMMVPGMKLPVNGLDLEVRHTPGHSFGSVCFLEKKLGLLFSGDTLLPLGPPRTVISPSGPSDLPWGGLAALERSLSDLAATGASTVLAGHGPPAPFGELITEAGQGLAARRRAVLKALGAGSTPFGMVRKTSGTPAVTVLRLMQLAETRCTLEALAGEGGVNLEVIDGVEYFSPRY